MIRVLIAPNYSSMIRAPKPVDEYQVPSGCLLVELDSELVFEYEACSRSLSRAKEAIKDEVEEMKLCSS